MTAEVILEIRDGVVWLALNRPEKLNAINDGMLMGLLEAADAIERDPTVGAAVLFGRGRAFSAGGDISAMEAMDEVTFATTIQMYMRLANAFRTLSKPVIAAVHGYAMAGGFELALICDVRIAAQGTQFRLPDALLGLSPTSGMTYLLPRIVGLGRALHMTLSAEPLDAEEAERVGLISKVVEPDALLKEAEALASKIASCPRVGVAKTKAEFYGALDTNFTTATEREEEGELECFRSAEVKGRFREFLSRRKR
jgi:enoyl-CoA hydratase/carnithine racemase